MMRILFYLVTLGLFMLGMAWLSEQPGAVTILWQGWQVETGAGVLAVLVVFVAIAAALVYRLWRGLVTAPRRFGRWRRERRLRSGYVALSSGLVAVAAGDPGEARRLAARAERLIDDKPLTLLLSAQAAQLSGDEDKAQRLFIAMAERKETEFLGLRGLLARAMRDGDWPRAVELARRARDLRPKTPWVLNTLLALQTRVGDWEGAADTLARAARAAAAPQAEIARHQAAVYLELSRGASRAGGGADALRYARLAHRAEAHHAEDGRADGGQAMATAWLAGLMADAGKRRRAGALVEREWTRRPHPALVGAYRKARRPESSLAWVKDAQKLAGFAPAHRQSQLAIGEAALEAGLWGEARRHFTAALGGEGGPAASTYRRLAQVEEADSGDPVRVRRWLNLAAEAHPDPGWICESCGTPHVQWQAVCRRCNAFDMLSWRAPDTLVPTLAAAAPSLGAIAAPPPN